MRVGKHQAMHTKCMMNCKVGPKFPAGSTGTDTLTFWT